MDTLYIVVPCFNEEEVLPITAAALEEKLLELKTAGRVSPESRILLVDDGSSDGTWVLINRLFSEHPHQFSGLKLTTNRGHQNALLAGLLTIKDRADLTISMDADLQDDIHAIDQMIDRYQEGYQVVYGVRGDRSTDTVFKRASAQGFYKFMAFLGVRLVYNHADYRLMSKAALDGLAQFPEVNLFLRGMVPLVGFPSTTVEYQRGERVAGESKYPLKKMLAFAWDGVTSFSIRPIRWITLLGVLILAISGVMLLWSVARLVAGYDSYGMNRLLVSHWLLGGLQMLSLGIVGEYIGKIYIETKKRPSYLVETLLDSNSADQ